MRRKEKPEQSSDKPISVRLPVDTHRRVMEHAAGLGISVSDLMKSMVSDWFNNRDAPVRPEHLDKATAGLHEKLDRVSQNLRVAVIAILSECGSSHPVEEIKQFVDEQMP
jgi:hypothetical protein